MAKSSRHERSGPDACGHELFDDQAERVPDATALVYKNHRITYRDLSDRTTRLADHLVHCGVGHESFVGLYTRSSIEAIVGLLGILKAGGVVVPLDPSNPRNRLVAMIGDSNPAVILTTSDLKDEIRSSDTDVIEIDSLSPIAPKAISIRETATTLDDAAFILYTSGSGGRPKGVIRTHRAIINRLKWMPYAEDDVFCHNMSLNVGFSQERLFLALMRGLPLVVVPEKGQLNVAKFVQILEDNKVTQVTLVPDILREILALGPDLARRLVRLRTIAVGSAPLRTELVDSFHALLPQIELVNAYGSTETGSVIRGRVPHGLVSDTAPIGRPVGETKAYILDSQKQPVPDGRIGELFVASPSLARGYLNLPELTAERFVENPFADAPASPFESRIYKTGDRARRLSDGSIMLLGREDRQVKIGSTRVELEEVERALARHESVAEVVVLARGSTESRHLIAYLVWREGRTSTHRALRQHLRRDLTEVMIPSTFFVCPELPRTLSRKIDVDALPAAGILLPRSEVEYVAPRTTTEKRMAAIWEEILPVRVGSAHDFGDYGDSLNRNQMLSSVWEVFGVDVESESLLTNPTLGEFSKFLDQLLAGGETAPPPAIQRVPRHNPLPLSISQESRFLYEHGAESNASLYVQSRVSLLLELQGAVDVSALEAAINEIARRHEVLRTVFVVEEEPDYIGFLMGGESSGSRKTARPHIQTGVRLELTRIVLSGDDESRRDEQALSSIREAVEQRFDYETPPLMRATLVQLDSGRHYLFFTLSHLIADAVSMNVFRRELSTLYEAYAGGNGSPLPDLGIQFVDFADWQNKSFDVERVRTFARRWRHHVLAFDDFSALELPFARPPEGNRDLAAGVVGITLDDGLRTQVRAASAELKSTPYVFMLAAVCLLLHIYTRRDNVALMIHFANRRHPATQQMIGWLANSFMIGVTCSERTTVAQLLEQVREIVMDADEHQDLPLPLVGGTVSDLLEKEGLPARKPAPPAPRPKISFEQMPVEAPTERGLRMVPIVLPVGRSEWGLRIMIHDHEDKTTIRAVYSEAMFDAHGVAEMLEDLIRVLERMPNSMKAPLSHFYGNVSRS